MLRTIEALARRVKQMEDRNLSQNIPVELRWWIAEMEAEGATEAELQKARDEIYTWADASRDWDAAAEADDYVTND